MNLMNVSHTVAPANAIPATKSLRGLYFLRAVFSVVWAVLISIFAKSHVGVASALFILYPAWDVFATYLDIKANPPHVSKLPQYVNIGTGVLTTIGVAFALQNGIPGALMVFGAWAIVAGAVQLVLGLRRRKEIGGQWPMIISGGQSVLAGTSFIAFAHKPAMNIGSVAGYAVFGAFYFLLAAIRLSKKTKATKNAGLAD